MSQSSMQSLAEVLMKMLEDRRSPLGHSFIITKIHGGWSRWLPASVAQNTKPLTLKGGCLTVWVKNSVWLYELNLSRKALIDRLNRELGGEAFIKDIRWTFQDDDQPSMEGDHGYCDAENHEKRDGKR
ncbi:MAG: DUF721 domain-containing protein [Bdellovibrionaceae bacterium]|nr:DUF721 domain-containing protein [Pseudobdellovibrionaceae bacterium]MDW8189518.1 DUF721 domain-containing protein [Pseudobdellovibrionaceae bacterium]